MAITVDTTLSTTSTNPVQNKAITLELNNKADSSSLPHGVPSGGTTGQVLVKSSNSDYAVEWQTVTVPSGTKNISISSNGTTTENVASYASAQISVSVANTYTAGDEGKVVSSGALVSQTAHADVTPTTSDQTIDTTTNNSIKVKGDADLVASNIKKDVEIFGVTGSYEGGGGYTTEQIMTGYPDGAVNYTPTENVTQYSICGRSKMTSLTVNVTGTIQLNREAIAYNRGMTSCTIIYPNNYTNKIVNYTVATNSSLTNLTIKGSVPNIETNAFRGNSSLKVCDITNTSSASYGIGGNVFYGTVLDTLILRKTDGIVPLDNISAFTNGTKFRSGGGGGTLYVPNALISTYQTATNWSTLLGYTGNVITKIEGTTYATTYADGTSV